MRWHDESRAWKNEIQLSRKHGKPICRWNLFRVITTKVRLGLPNDGFDPFGDKSPPYSICLLLLIPCNVSHEMYLKDTNYLFSILIHRPKAPTCNIDVYMQPLID